MPGFWKTIRKSFGDAYDYLGTVIICSFIWFGVLLGTVSAWAGLGTRSPIAWIAFAFGFYSLLLGPLTAGVFHVGRKIVTRDDPTWVEMFRGAREYWGGAVLLALGQTAITMVIGVNAWFYFGHKTLVFRALGGVFLYGLVVWLMSALYHYPILIEQRPGLVKIVKRGFLVTLDNPAFTAGVFFAIILLTFLSVAVMLPMALLWAGLAGVILTRALRALFVKYELLPPEREPSPDDDPWEAVADDPRAGGRDPRSAVPRDRG